MNRRRKGLVGCLGGLILFVILLLVTPQGRFIIDALNYFRPWEKAQTHKYDGTSRENLKALTIALGHYHDSEGQFPDAKGWMDSVEKYLDTADLKKGESEKKLIRPDLLGQSGKFGYAMNDAASGKYKDDIKDKKTVILFESTETTRNAHGDPKKIGVHGGQGIALDGTIVKLP